MSAYRKYIIASLVVVVLAIGGGAVWHYYHRADLMAPSPLGEITLGRPDAPVTIIEYASTTCTHCAHFDKTTFPELRKRYIDTGQVRYIFREFPLNDVDFYAFMLARCAGNDRFLSFVDVLFNEQEKWLVEAPQKPLMEIAKQAGLSDETIAACRTNQKIFDGVNWSSENALKLSVESTPTFFINGKMHLGDMSIEELAKLIAQASKK